MKATTQSIIPERATREPGIHNHEQCGLASAVPPLLDLWLWIPLGPSGRPGMTTVMHQNFTCGGFSAPSVAVNSAIGLLPEKAVFAQSTVGKVRSAVL